MPRAIVGYRRFVTVRALASCSLLAALALPGSSAAATRTPLLDAGQRVRTPTGESVQRERAVSWGAATGRASATRIDALRAELGPLWIAWDDRTQTPHRIALAGVPVPGAMASPAIAEAAAWDVLQRHLPLLAPGSRASDFVLVADDLSAGIRSIGFAQHVDGVPVRGGQLHVRFKHDKLVMIGSDALPHVRVRTPVATVAPADAHARARSWIDADLPGARASTRHEALEILPLHRADGRIDYALALPVVVEVEAPRSRWRVWLDAETGAPLARQQELHFDNAGIVYRVPVRSPQNPPGDYGAPFVQLEVDGVPLVTDGAGVFEFTTQPGAGNNSPTGPFVDIVNEAGPLASQSFVASPGSGWVWSAGADDELDAQLAAFVHLSTVKAYVRGIAPDLAWLDGQIQGHVNVDDECNAMSDGDSVFFYRASATCENTGRIADVVYHEFGHSVHHQSIIPGVGFFDTALSEGTSDYLSMTIIGESGLARGFFYDDTPLRELDPPDYEYHWPEDRGEVHDEGRIIGGALWDLRKAMIAKYGQSLGVFATDRIWYESTRRAVDIPSMYIEALVVDDDDGNLANGTPNVCEIDAAYGPHGLFSIGEAAETVTAEVTADGIAVSVQAALPNHPQCPVAAAPTLAWRREGEEEGSAIDMTPGQGVWSAVIPAQAAGTVVEYQVRMNYDNGTLRALPDNIADPWYEAYVGDVVPLYCTGFVDGALDWSLQGDWNVGAPAGNAGNRDPLAAWDDDGVVLGNHVDSGGLYSPNSVAVATSPTVATAGYAGVRLQYRRWLTVEDGFFDQAGIEADDAEVWSHLASPEDYLATRHHVDREWRFHDVDLTAAAADGSVAVSFTLQSDGGLEFGGWNLDGFCIVGVNSTASSCGDGVIDAAEQCDDGNVADGDGCGATCMVEAPGETGDDTGAGPGGDTEGEDGSSDGGAGEVDDGGGLLGRGCACASAAGAGAGSPWWLIGVAFVRRRRASARVRAGR